MRSLITGSTGFVGRYLCAHLEDQGDEVITTDRAMGGPDIIDRDAVIDFFIEARPEIVYHLAGQAHVPTSWSDPASTLRINVEGTQNVLDASRLCEARRVIAVTSAEVYGPASPPELPLNETSPLRPLSPYAASKAAAESVATQAFLGWGLDVVRVRAFNHLGPGQSQNFVAAGLAHRIASAELNGHTQISIGNLSAQRDFTDVDDVVRAYRLLAEQAVAGEVYNVCSGIPRAISEIAEGFLSMTSGQLELVTNPDLMRPVEEPIRVGDSSKLFQATGWKPEVPFQESLSRILAHARVIESAAH